MNPFVLDSINLHLLCLSEHHVDEQGLLSLILSGHSLGPSYCRRNLQEGGVCIYVSEDRSFKKKLTSCLTVQSRLKNFVHLNFNLNHLTWEC
jgi:hypothetical protein